MANIIIKKLQRIQIKNAYLLFFFLLAAGVVMLFNRPSGYQAAHTHVLVTGTQPDAKEVTSREPEKISIPSNSSKISNLSKDELIRKIEDILGDPEQRKRKEALSELLIALSRLDIKAAILLCEGVQSVFRTPMIEVVMADYFHLNNLENGLEIIEGIDNSTEKDAALGIAARSVGVKDRVKFFEILAKIDSNQAKEITIFHMIRGCMLQNNEDVLGDFTSKLPIEHINSVLQNPLTLKDLTNICPDEVIKCVNKITLTETSIKTIKSLVKTNSITNYNLYSEFINNLPAGLHKNTIESEFFSSLAQQDSVFLENTIGGMAAKDAKVANSELLKYKAKNNLDEVLSDIKSSLVDTDAALLSDISVIATNANPSSVKTILNETSIISVLEESFTNDLVKNSASKWANKNITQVKEWIDTLSANRKPYATQGLVASWMKSDPIAASEWLSQQPAGPARDAGAQEIINQIKDTDPETAEQWRKSMTPK
jgi:hypothetical protein